MILYVYLQGGLGNQMFQYAAGVSALKEYPQFTELRLDTSFYSNQERKVIVNGLTGRGYDLDILNIKHKTYKYNKKSKHITTINIHKSNSQTQVSQSKRK